MLSDVASKLGNFLIHGCNSLACLLDIFISDRPWNSLHFFYPILMGLTYAAFSLIYWGAGGLGQCFDEPHDGATVQVGNLYCAPYIYPEILDWENHPEQAVITIAAVCAVMPFVHFLWMGLHKFRQWIYNKRRNSDKKPLVDNSA